jgi:hypothetical protein
MIAFRMIQLSNTTLILLMSVREICYSWHPWHGRAVRVHASLAKRGQAAAYRSLDDVQAGRVLEVPLWMLDVAAFCKARHPSRGS